MPSTDVIQIDSFVPEVQAVIRSAPMPGLGPVPKCSDTKSGIVYAMQGNELAGTLVEAALWLLAGELDRSHKISQSDNSSEGSFWHGIMHRREGDFWNSKFWFRRVGTHPVHAELVRLMQSNEAALSASGMPVVGLMSPSTIATELVDLCEQCQTGKTEWTPALERICWWEWQLLFSSCNL